MKNYILALDAGTTSGRALLVDRAGRICSCASIDLPQHFPHPGYVEHDPEDIYSSVYRAICDTLDRVHADAGDIEAIGITNQRETCIVWEADTLKPVCNAISWQCRRTASICEFLTASGEEEYIRSHCGLLSDAYFSGTKLKWILDNIEGARRLATQGKLRFGTVDSWLVCRLTGGKMHLTDCSNAARTMLFDINTLKWDGHMLDILGVPESMLPQVLDSGADFGCFSFRGHSIPILAVLGDQQSSLFGQTCFEPGDLKNTYGTGCFTLMNTGNRPVFSENRLITTVAWRISGKTTYAIEGSVFNAGSAIKWLRDEVGLISTPSEGDLICEELTSCGGVCFVPAFTGLGAPRWDMYARGGFSGITRGSGRRELVRAVYESICYQSRQIFELMRRDSGIGFTSLKVDGGASVSDFLMSFQAEQLAVPVDRPLSTETTALGAAYLAGLQCGFFSSFDEVRSLRRPGRVYYPHGCKEEADRLYARWLRAVDRVARWEEET